MDWKHLHSGGRLTLLGLLESVCFSLGSTKVLALRTEVLYLWRLQVVNKEWPSFMLNVCWQRDFIILAIPFLEWVKYHSCMKEIMETVAQLKCQLTGKCNGIWLLQPSQPMMRCFLWWNVSPLLARHHQGCNYILYLQSKRQKNWFGRELEILFCLLGLERTGKFVKWLKNSVLTMIRLSF